MSEQSQYADRIVGGESSASNVESFKSGAWIMRCGSVALAAAAVAAGLKTRDFGVFAGLWGGSMAVGWAAETVADMARKKDPNAI